MATYRFSAQVIGRSTGRSSVAAAAYRAGAEMTDERTGQRHDYRRRGGVVHAEVLAPENAPDWMRDRARLWNAVEIAERRKDAQLAREVQLSLPHELTDDQRRALVTSFVRSEFVDCGMIADLAIHRPTGRDDERNHHVHVMLTMRALTGDGFGKKERGWNDAGLLETWRERWAEVQNRTLERHGHKERVDHRSYEARGIDREAEPKQGAIATEIERQGRRSKAGDDRRAAQARNAVREAREAQLTALQAEIARERAALEQERRRIAQAEAKARETLAQTKTAEADLTALRQTQENRGLIARMVASVTGRAKQERARAAQSQTELEDLNCRRREEVERLERSRAEEQRRAQQLAAQERRLRQPGPPAHQRPSPTPANDRSQDQQPQSLADAFKASNQSEEQREAAEKFRRARETGRSNERGGYERE